MATVVLQLKARVGGQAVDIPLDDVSRAVAPRYPTDRNGYVIDLTALHDEADATFNAARAEIRHRTVHLYSPGMEADRVHHLSVFALAPIPLLVYLGTRLSNKIPVELHQRHRDTGDWVWKSEPSKVEFEVQVVRHGTDPAKVGVVLPLSGTRSKDDLPATIDSTFTLYQLGLRGLEATPDFLRTRDDLSRFGHAYRGLLATIETDHPSADLIHLFPATPAPIAIACGYHLLQKAHPPLLVYDYVKAEGGFLPRLRTDDQDVR